MTPAPLNSSACGVVAAFDFDKTLSNRDCVIPFVRRHLTRRRTLASIIDLPKAAASIARRDRDRLKAIVSRRAFAGIPRAVLEEDGRNFARHIRESWMRADTMETLRWHKENGHCTGVVSASYGLYLRPLGEELGLDFVLATELEFDASDRATGRLVDGNCRGPEKAKRLRDWLQAHEFDNSVLYAYGDSSGDRELLEMSDHPHLIVKESS